MIDDEAIRQAQTAVLVMRMLCPACPAAQLSPEPHHRHSASSMTNDTRTPPGRMYLPVRDRDLRLRTHTRDTPSPWAGLVGLTFLLNGVLPNAPPPPKYYFSFLLLPKLFLGFSSTNIDSLLPPIDISNTLCSDCRRRNLTTLLSPIRIALPRQSEPLHV